MAKIVVSDLRPVGSDLFIDSESYLHDLEEIELNNTGGGIVPGLLYTPRIIATMYSYWV